MRIANTIKITAHAKNPAQQEALVQALKRYANTPAETQTLTHEQFPTLYVVKLWLTKQQEIRSLLRFLSTLSLEDKNTLLHQITERIDERGNFYFRIDKQAFLRQQAIYAEKGDVVQLRINMAAHPKTPENVEELVRAFLHAKDVNL